MLEVHLRVPTPFGKTQQTNKLQPRCPRDSHRPLISVHNNYDLALPIAEGGGPRMRACVSCVWQSELHGHTELHGQSHVLIWLTPKPRTIMITGRRLDMLQADKDNMTNTDLEWFRSILFASRHPTSQSEGSLLYVCMKEGGQTKEHFERLTTRIGHNPTGKLPFLVI